MRRSCLLTLCLLACLIVSVFPVQAQLPQISSGLKYLTTAQTQDGTWQSETVESAAATLSALDTLKLLGQTANTTYINGTIWLQAQSPLSVNYIAERLRVLGISDVGNLLSATDSIKGGWGGDEGYETNQLDTSFVLQALKSANYTDSNAIFAVVKYLLANQNSDGGWGFTQDADSNVFVTAQVVSAIAQYKGTYQMNTQLASAAAFLLSNQNPDNGFGSDTSTVYETALALIALIESGQTHVVPLQNALNYLTTTQSVNGSWNDDPYSTALALRALSYIKPDLSVLPADIAILPATPTVGSSITVTAAVANIGLETAVNVTVRLLDNGVAVGDQTIASLAPGGMGQAAFGISPLTPVGEHLLTVSIDPGNSINEVSKANNSAFTRLWAKASADLVVQPENLTIIPAYPKPGETITLTVAIANMGESDAAAFTGDLYDGDPNNGGIKLGSFSNSGIVAGQWGNGSVAFSLAAAGSHSLYLVIDPQHLISETSTTNNTAIKLITVNTESGAGFTDLAIPINGLSITPQRPHAGDAVTITLLADNLGTEAVSADLELFDGNPAAGGIQLYKSSVTLNAGESRTISVPWQVPSGVHTLYAWIDRANVVAERDDNNNSRVLAAMADMVDIEISASDLSITPERPMDGDPATVKMMVQNRGIASTGAFNVNLYNGDPNNGGTLLQTFAIADLAGDTTKELSYTFTAASGTYRFYAVCDPENKVAELYKDNNLAIRSLLVKTSSETKGADLVPLTFDLSGVTTDPQSLRISGMAKVTFQNKGDDKVSTPFRITVFEDNDGDGVYSEGTDQTLGVWDYATSMNPNMVGEVSINLIGTVTFRDAPIYAMLDSGQVVFEQSKSNNSIRRGSDCENRPANPIEPNIEVKWRWKQFPTVYNVGYTYTPPVIASLGLIDGKNIPAVVFVTAHENFNIMSNYSQGRLRALRGDTGEQLFTYYDFNHGPYTQSHVAVADIDGDGEQNIIVSGQPSSGSAGNLLAIRPDGTLKWDNLAQAKAWSAQGPTYYGYATPGGPPLIADIDGDGKPKIIVGKTVINGDGSIKWGTNYYGGTGTGLLSASELADLDLDGKQEVVAGFTAYNSNGSVRWNHPELTDGYTAIGKFDDALYPEIVLATNYQGRARIYLLDHNGNINWGPVDFKVLNLPDTGFAGYASPPTIADFDGDGQVEIGVMGNNKYFILDKNGNLKRTLSIPGYNSQPIAATVFDLNGDKKPKILIHTAGFFRIFDGASGLLLFEDSFGAGSTVYQTVQVVDVSGDGEAKIVVTGYDPSSDPIKSRDAIRVYGSKNHDWVNTRSIWNQPSYHVTNINDDGSIPQYEAPSWLLNNSYRCQAPTSSGPSPYQAADLSASFVRVDLSGYPSSAVITARIGNGGARLVDAGVKVNIHAGDPAGDGTLIGTAMTSRPLNPGEYEDITFTWNTPPEGAHKLVVVADPDAAISECNKTNNTVELSVVIAGGQPDLSISAGDLLIPATVQAGSLAQIAATVRNNGTAPSAASLLRLYAGNPAAGGKQIGIDVSVPALPAGGTATSKIAWNTLGVQGISWIYAVVDPDAQAPDANRSNNSAMKELQVLAAEKPDLQIQPDYITVSPQSVREGEPVSITADIYNRGLAIGNIKVALHDGNPVNGGRLVAVSSIQPILAAGESARVYFAMDTVGISGSRQLYLTLDPDNSIAEADESNNQAVKTVTIASAAIGLDLITDKSGYGANEPVVFTAYISNAKAGARTVAYDLLIMDLNNVQAAVVQAEGQLALEAAATRSITVPWNSGTLYSGNYRAQIRLKEDGRIIARASVGLAILPSKVATVGIASDKISYHSSEQVAATTTITGTSPNYQFSNLTVTTTITSSSGQQLFSAARTIASLANGQRLEIKNYWNAANNPGGSYILRAELLEGTTSIATASATFSIESSANNADGLTGSMIPAAVQLEAGQEQQITCVVENKGNAAISAGTLQLLIVDPDSGVALKTLEPPGGLLMLDIGGSRSSSALFSTSGLPVKPLLAILLIETTAGTKSLASTVFTVVDTTLPTLVVSALSDGSVTKNETLNLAGTATDNSGIKELLINGTVVPVAQDNSFSYAVVLKTGDNLIQTVVTDLAGNQTTDSRTIRLDQTAPELTISTPADNSKTAVADLQLSGTLNETATVSVKLADAEQPVSLNDTGFSAQLVLKPGINTIIVTATDLAGNSSSLKRTVIYDDQKPSLAVTVPAQDIRTNKADVTIAGTVSDPYTAVTVSITVDGITYTPAVVDGQFEQPLTFSEEKNYAIIVTATNEAGTSTVVQRNVIYDITPPGFTLNPVVSPTQAAEQLVSGTREAGSTVMVTCSTAVVGTVAYPDDTTWQVGITNLTVGENPITAVATDETGNSSTLTTQITYTLPSQEPLFGYAIFGNSGINVAGAVLTDSYRTGICSGHNKGSIGTNATQRCAIRLTGAAIIRGKALVGSGGNPSQGICLTGLTAVTAGLGTLEKPKPMQPVSDPGGGQNMGSLNLSGNKGKTLGEGTYRFSSLSLSGTTVLTVTGKTTIIVDGTFSITGCSRIEIPSSASLTLYLNGQSLSISGSALLNRSLQPQHLVVYGTPGLKNIKLSGIANLHGLIYAPSADITMSGALQLFGAVVGNNVTIEGGSAVHFDETLLEN